MRAIVCPWRTGLGMKPTAINATLTLSLFHRPRTSATLSVPQTEVAAHANRRKVGRFAVASGVPSSTPNSATALCANVMWNTCLLEFTVRGSITHGSITGFFDEPRSVDFEPGHPVRSP